MMQLRDDVGFEPLVHRLGLLPLRKPPKQG